VSAAVAAQAQRPAYPNWKPRLGVLCAYSDANLEFVKAEGFTSMELRLDPDQLDDNRIATVKAKIAKAGIYVSSLACDGNHIDPDPAKRQQQNNFTAKCIELCGKLGITFVLARPDGYGFPAEFAKNYSSQQMAIGFGSQVRTYTLQPYTMVKDERTDHKKSDANSVLDGNLDEFIEAYLLKAASDREATKGGQN